VSKIFEILEVKQSNMYTNRTVKRLIKQGIKSKASLFGEVGMAGEAKGGKCAAWRGGGRRAVQLTTSNNSIIINVIVRVGRQRSA